LGFSGAQNTRLLSREYKWENNLVIATFASIRQCLERNTSQKNTWTRCNTLHKLTRAHEVQEKDTNLNLKFQSLWQNNIEVMNIANVLFLYAIQYNITTLIQCNRFIYWKIIISRAVLYKSYKVFINSRHYLVSYAQKCLFPSCP
jgi:hypothetical protein